MDATDVLIVEDDRDLGKTLLSTLKKISYNVDLVTTLEEAVLYLQEKKVGLVLSDIQLHQKTGQELLLHIKSRGLKTPVLFMTAFGNVKDAVQAMQNGACDYLTKPFETEVLLNAIENYRLQKETANSVVVCDPKSLELLQLAEKVARSDASVLITGPSGSGKEVLAHTFIALLYARKNLLLPSTVPQFLNKCWNLFCLVMKKERIRELIKLHQENLNARTKEHSC